MLQNKYSYSTPPAAVKLEYEQKDSRTGWSCDILNSTAPLFPHSHSLLHVWKGNSVMLTGKEKVKERREKCEREKSGSVQTERWKFRDKGM